MKPPLAVMIVAAVYLLVGVVGFAYHFPELMAGHRDAIAIELTELLAVVSGGWLAAAEELGTLARAGMDCLSCRDQPLSPAAGAADPRRVLRPDRLAAVPARDGAVVQNDRS